MDKDAEANVMDDTEVSAFADYENTTEIESGQIPLVEQSNRQ